jgi:hypothetical protein
MNPWGVMTGATTLAVVVLLGYVLWTLGRPILGLPSESWALIVVTFGAVGAVFVAFAAGSRRGK